MIRRWDFSRKYISGFQGSPSWITKWILGSEVSSYHWRQYNVHTVIFHVQYIYLYNEDIFLFLNKSSVLKINCPGCIGAFFIPHGGFGPTWMYVGLIGGMLFIIIQLVLIIDFAHSWAESWQAEYSASQVQVIVYINSTRYFMYQQLCYIKYIVHRVHVFSYTIQVTVVYKSEKQFDYVSQNYFNVTQD